MKHYTPIAAPVVAGIDVSKAHLDVYLHPEGKRRRFNNDKTGWRAHRDWLAKAEPEHVVYEATGRYHKGFERYLGGHGLPIARLDPRRAAPDALPRPLACKPKRTWSMPAFWPNSGLS